MLPGPTVMLIEAGVVGWHANPSTTVLVPNTAWARKPRPIMAFLLTERRSVSNGMALG